MDSQLSIAGIATLAGAMALLAALPSVSVLTVVARAAAGGFAHGAAAAAGIVVGDLVFIAIAVGGMAALAEAAGPIAPIIQLVGGAYLVYLGVATWRAAHAPSAARTDDAPAAPPTGGALTASFTAGLVVTLADVKAILFYLGFFPAFLDLTRVTATDVGIVVAVTIVAVGGVKLAYAAAADRARAWLARGRAGRALQTVAAAVLTGVGVFVIVSAFSV